MGRDWICMARIVLGFTAREGRSGRRSLEAIMETLEDFSGLSCMSDLILS
jgi:hypothetical protein